MLLRFFTRVLMIVMLIIIIVVYPVYEFILELYRAWENFRWWQMVRWNMGDIFKSFYRDFKLGRFWETKQEKEERIKHAMDDL